ncbi:MAG: hypothetical protein GY715_02160 [Planctomycetes bacterium]|nr:hypothetical protein [Planctomycetota bacterium]
MRPHRLITAPMIACALVSPLVGGCEDDASRQRAAAQEAIETAGNDLELALVSSPLPGDDNFEATRGKLQGIVTGLTRLNGADEGQQVAADLLLAASHSRLAGMRLTEVQQIETNHRARRAELHSQLDAALRLDGLAEAREGLSSDGSRDHLEGERDKSEDRLAQFSQRLAELDEPISERRARNREDGGEATRLDGEANDLRREAARQGHAGGLGTYEEAIRLERKADQYEYRIAQRRNELEYEYMPEHQLAERRAELAREMMQTVSATENSLDEQDSIRANEIRTTRELVGQFRERIEAGLNEIDATAASELAERYDETLQHLEKTRTAANRALTRSPREGKDTARLALARAHEVEGRMYAARAMGLTGQAAILERLADAGDSVGNADRYRSELSRVTTAADEAVEKAKAALAEARDTLGSVTSKDARPHVAEVVAGLDRHLAALSGVEPPERMPAERSTGGRTSAPANTPARGFASADEIIALMSEGQDADFDAAVRVVDAIHTPSATSRSMVKGLRSILEPMSEFMSAISDTFGEDALEQLQSAPGMDGMTTQYDDIEITNRTDDVVTVKYTEPDGSTPTLDLVKVGDAWFIDGDSMVATMAPEELQSMDMVSAMMGQMFGGMAKRIRAGEFASVEEFQQAMMQEMMGGAGMGGMPEGMGAPGVPSDR